MNQRGNKIQGGNFYFFPLATLCKNLEQIAAKGIRNQFTQTKRRRFGGGSRNCCWGACCLTRRGVEMHTHTKYTIYIYLFTFQYIFTSIYVLHVKSFFSLVALLECVCSAYLRRYCVEAAYNLCIGYLHIFNIYFV